MQFHITLTAAFFEVTADPSVITMDAEDRAWARLEEKILAEVSNESMMKVAGESMKHVTEVEEILVFEEGQDLRNIDQVDINCPHEFWARILPLHPCFITQITAGTQHS